LIHVRVNANLTSFTVEELKSRKKEMHLAAFKYVIVDTGRVLQAIVGEGGVRERLSKDVTSQEDGIEGNLDTFLTKILDQGRAVMSRHEQVEPEEFSKDERFRRMVEEMLQFRTAAESTLRCYVELPSGYVMEFMNRSVNDSHRIYLNLLLTGLAKSGDDEATKKSHALRLCKLLGLVENSPDERDDDMMNPLMREASKGAGSRPLQCLVWAGADANAGDASGKSAAMYAAEGGHSDTLKALAELKADVSQAKNDGATAVMAAAAGGHVEAIRALAELKADVSQADNDGKTPLQCAKERGHADAVALLQGTVVDIS